jgi:hypothetical protein
MPKSISKTVQRYHVLNNPQVCSSKKNHRATRVFRLVFRSTFLFHKTYSCNWNPEKATDQIWLLLNSDHLISFGANWHLPGYTYISQQRHGPAWFGIFWTRTWKRDVSLARSKCASRFDGTTSWMIIHRSGQQPLGRIISHQGHTNHPPTPGWHFVMYNNSYTWQRTHPSRVWLLDTHLNWERSQINLQNSPATHQRGGFWVPRVYSKA